MTYRIEITATARAEIRETTHWLAANRSPTFANTWLAELSKVLRTLEKQPLLYPSGTGKRHFPEDIRELLYGKGKSGKYRVIFEIIDDIVYVLMSAMSLVMQSSPENADLVPVPHVYE